MKSVQSQTTCGRFLSRRLGAMYVLRHVRMLGVTLIYVYNKGRNGERDRRLDVVKFLELVSSSLLLRQASIELFTAVLKPPATKCSYRVIVISTGWRSGWRSSGEYQSFWYLRSGTAVRSVVCTRLFSQLRWESSLVAREPTTLKLDEIKTALDARREVWRCK